MPTSVRKDEQVSLAVGRLALHRLGAAGLVLLAALISGCATTPAGRSAPPITELDTAVLELPATDVLNVNIAVFEANVPVDPDVAEVERVFADVRAAEARYIPYALRRVLEASGQWGAVRVVPGPMITNELLVTGTILESHGEALSLHIRAVDAGGRVWLDRSYSEKANAERYVQVSQRGIDPFQDLYHRIANDLVAARQRLSEDQKREIRELANLRFAAELVPQRYQGYLVQDQDRVRMARRPDDDDPMLALIDQARMRDDRMIDILDQHYRNFHAQMDTPYTDWRMASYQEIENYRELRRQANTRKALGALLILGGIIGAVESNSDLGDLAAQAAIIGGIYAVASGIDRGRQTAMHIEALRELGQSLEADLEPQVLDIEDRTVRLTGSAEEQQREWRRILGEMLAEQAEAIGQNTDPAGLQARLQEP